MNFFEALAIIFSRSSAPPPPFVGAVDGDVDFAGLMKVDDGDGKGFGEIFAAF
jgi:hypothetical protein